MGVAYNWSADNRISSVPCYHVVKTPRILGIEEGQAFLEDTDANKLCLGAPDPDRCQLEGAMQQARPL